MKRENRKEIFCFVSSSSFRRGLVKLNHLEITKNNLVLFLCVFFFGGGGGFQQSHACLCKVDFVFFFFFLATRFFCFSCLFGLLWMNSNLSKNPTYTFIYSSYVLLLYFFFFFLFFWKGPAGSGKSTYCHVMQEHAKSMTGIRRRRIHVINLDPAAEIFTYDCILDVRELISVPDVMLELGLGPNGALVYSMEYLLEHLQWLQDALDENFMEDDTVLLDCPGQVELYTHVPIMKTILDQLQLWGYEGKMVSVYCVDAAYLIDISKFISGSLLALSAMIALELPHINVLTKADLMSEEQIDSILSQSATQLWYNHQQQDVRTTTSSGLLLRRQQHNHNNNNVLEYSSSSSPTSNNDNHKENKNDTAADTTPRPRPPPAPPQQEQEQQREEVNGPFSSSSSYYYYQPNSSSSLHQSSSSSLTNAICQLLEDYNMVSFIPLDIQKEDSIEHVLATVDHVIQYGEDLDVREPMNENENDNDEEEND